MLLSRSLMSSTLNFSSTLALSLHLAGVLEEADAGLEQHDALQRQIGGPRLIGPSGGDCDTKHHGTASKIA